MAKSRVRCQPVTSIAAGVSQCYADIERRAYERYETRGEKAGGTLDDWLRAEAELIWKPAVEVVEAHSHVIVEAAIAGVPPSALDVQVSPDDVLIRADIHHVHDASKGTVHLCEFRGGQLFRIVHLPRPVDPLRAHTEYRDGLLKVVAPLAAEHHGRSTDAPAP